MEQKQLLEAAAALGAYPLSLPQGLLTELEHLIGGEPHLGEALRRVRASFQGESLSSLQESYTRAFDLMAAAPLHAGHHLFGEDTQRRTQFLIRLSEAQREHGVDIESELPDFIPHLLRLAAVLPQGEPRHLLFEEVLLPVLQTMGEALGASPWKAVADFWAACCHEACVVRVPATAGAEASR